MNCRTAVQILFLSENIEYHMLGFSFDKNQLMQVKEGSSNRNYHGSKGMWAPLVEDDFEDLKIPLDGPTRLYRDNKLAIIIAYNSVQYDKKKHIEVDQHLIKETLNSEVICTPTHYSHW